MTDVRAGAGGEADYGEGSASRSAPARPNCNCYHDGDGGPDAFIQYKGSDICADVRCSCGALLHYDGEGFGFYAVQCPHCLTKWEVGTTVPLHPYRENGCPVHSGGFGGHNVTLLDPDEHVPA